VRKILPKLDTKGQRVGDEIIESEVTDSPLTDDVGNPIEAGTVEALLRKVREHFEGDTEIGSEVLRVAVRKTETVQVLLGAEFKAARQYTT
jgi:hypothetical protein